jgi:predicted  nucleic acid-binding Zn-ribbon protein
MGEDKTQDLLLQLLQDMAIVKSKLDSIEEIKIDVKSSGNRIDHLEAQNERHEKQIQSLENRSNTLEKFVRDNLTDSKKTQTSVFISIGIAIFSTVLTIVSRLF